MDLKIYFKDFWNSYINLIYVNELSTKMDTERYFEKKKKWAHQKAKDIEKSDIFENHFRTII